MEVQPICRQKQSICTDQNDSAGFLRFRFRDNNAKSESQVEFRQFTFPSLPSQQVRDRQCCGVQLESDKRLEAEQRQDSVAVYLATREGGQPDVQAD